MPYTPILATLGYVISPDRQHTLLVHRNARPGDQHLGKYNGLGGKIHQNEDVVSGMKREIQEEAQLTCLDLTLRGTISWPGFGKNGEAWFGFIFRIDRFEGVPPSTNDEGTLSWVPIAEILDLPLWAGDRYFLPLVFDDDPRVFHGVMPYHGGTPQHWHYNRI